MIPALSLHIRSCLLVIGPCSILWLDQGIRNRRRRRGGWFIRRPLRKVEGQHRDNHSIGGPNCGGLGVGRVASDSIDRRHDCEMGC